MNWYKPENLNKGLPDSIKVFASESSYTPGVPLYCLYALVDLQDEDIDFKISWRKEGENLLTPS